MKITNKLNQLTNQLTNLALAFALLAFSTVIGFAQTVTLSTTTLGAALTSTATTVTLASTSTMQGIGGANAVQTCFYVDKEVFGVVSVVNSTTVTVQRRGGACGSVGASQRPTGHVNGAKVYFANTTTAGNFVTNAAQLIGVNLQTTAENYGSCTAANEMMLPRIYLYSGDIFNCIGGQWMLQSNGASASAGRQLVAQCSGTAGSAETEYLVPRACSGSTSAAGTPVSTGGYLANLQVLSSAAVVGGAGKDVMVVLVNGTASGITCTIAASGTTCSDVTHSAYIAAGSYVGFQFVTATSDTAANVSASVGVY